MLCASQLEKSTVTWCRHAFKKQTNWRRLPFGQKKLAEKVKTLTILQCASLVPVKGIGIGIGTGKKSIGIGKNWYQKKVLVSKLFGIGKKYQYRYCLKF